MVRIYTTAAGWSARWKVDAIVSQSENSDLNALSTLLSELTKLQVALKLVSEELSALQGHTQHYNLLLSHRGEFEGLSYIDDIGLNSILPADTPRAEAAKFHCEWLTKYVDGLWEAWRSADSALGKLSSRLTGRLDALAGKPWVALVRRHCIDKILAWPGEAYHQTSLAAEKVYGNPAALLEKARKSDPFPTWNEYERLILGYKADLFAIRDAVQAGIGDKTAASEVSGSDTPLDDATMAKARAMHAYLRELSTTNTAIRSMVISSPGSNMAITTPSNAPPGELSPQERANRAKLFPGGVPSNTDIVDLVVRLDSAKGSGQSMNEVAREFTNETKGNDPRAQSLLSQIRRMQREGRITLSEREQ